MLIKQLEHIKIFLYAYNFFLAKGGNKNFPDLVPEQNTAVQKGI